MSSRLVSAFAGIVFAPVFLALAGCMADAPPPAPPAPAPAPVVESSPDDQGAISVAPVAPDAAGNGGKRPVPARGVDWSPVALEPGKASVACALEYANGGDGVPLAALDREAITAALEPCVATGVFRLRWKGRIAADFAALVQRVTQVAGELGIAKRVLDIDSTGGQVEDAIRAGDVIAESRWTIWVREDSLCHSACVFVLSAGDVRRVAGKVGIHRIIRMSSTATTRAELNAELQIVYQRVRDYLQRNGTNVAVADLMTAVPNRNVRILSADELVLFGLDGVNPAQDDLDRLRLLRECGEDFVLRRDAFAAAFDRQCRRKVTELDELNACGLALRPKYGFPDAECPAESPLSEFDLAQAEPEPAAPAGAAPESSESAADAAPAGTAATADANAEAAEAAPADPVDTED